MVADYVRLSKEVQVLNKLKLSHSHSDDLISELISVRTQDRLLYYFAKVCTFDNRVFDESAFSHFIQITTEREALKREVMEMGERMQFLQKNSRELELDNEKLTFKVSFIRLFRGFICIYNIL